jgi:hypothetical protein
MTPSVEVVRVALSKLSETRVTGEFGDSSARNLATEYEQTIWDAATFAGITNVSSASTCTSQSLWGAYQFNPPFGRGAELNALCDPFAGIAGTERIDATVEDCSTAPELFRELSRTKGLALIALVGNDFQARERLFCITDHIFRFAEARTETLVTPGKEVEFPWLYKTYLLVKEGLQAQALKALYWGIEDLLAARQFSSINRVFAQVDLLKLSPEVMIGLIRSTYRARLAISSWATLLKRIAEELERRAIPNWQNLLVGLSAPKSIAAGTNK